MDDTNLPEVAFERFEKIENIMPHLEDTAEQLLSQPDLNQRHRAYNYCRGAIMLAKAEKEISKNERVL